METKILIVLNGWMWRKEVRVRLVRFFANPFIALTMVAVLATLLIHPILRAYTIVEFSEILFALIIARAMVTPFLHAIVRRQRPYTTVDLERVFVPNGTRSFPSGHATFFAAFGFAILPISALWGTVMLLATALNGLARVTGALHWPTDIVAGYVVGYFGAFAAVELLAWLPIEAVMAYL